MIFTTKHPQLYSSKILFVWHQSFIIKSSGQTSLRTSKLTGWKHYLLAIAGDRYIHAREISCSPQTCYVTSVGKIYTLDIQNRLGNDFGQPCVRRSYVHVIIADDVPYPYPCTVVDGDMANATGFCSYMLTIKSVIDLQSNHFCRLVGEYCNSMW